MVTELDNLTRLRKDQIKTAARMLARAFKDDPIINYAFPDESERNTKLPYVYEFLLRYYCRYSNVYTTSEQLEGVTIWQRHEHINKKVKMSLRQLVLSGSIWPALKMGTQAGKRMQPFSEYIENKRWELLPHPHWYLMLIGVDPDFQGKGYASKLIKAMLITTDNEAMPCYLETEDEKNIALYQHFSFEVIEEFIVPDTSVKLWAMLREHQTPQV